MKNVLKNRKAMSTMAGVLIAIIFLSCFGAAMVYVFRDEIFGGSPQPSPSQSANPWPTFQPSSGDIGPTYSGILYLEVVDSVLGTGVTTSTTTVDVCAAEGGVFDFISGPKDTKAQSANPQAMNTIWAEGTELIIMPDCTGNPTSGLDYYPAMYYVKLYQGASVYQLDNKNCFVLADTDPYRYTINLASATQLSQKVQKYQASNVYYWNVGKLHMYPRQQANSFDQYLTYNGATLASVTDASTWVDTAAEITANATLASTNEHVTFQMVGALANVGWGKHFYVVGSNGKIHEYGSVIIVTTAMTAISASKFADEDWNSITASNLYAEKGYYKVLEPAMPTKGNKANWQVSIPVDSSAATASTAYKFSVWLNDCQNLGTVGEVGSSTSVPTAYGFVTSYGVGAVVANTALTFSSGAGATMQLESYLTTPS